MSLWDDITGAASDLFGNVKNLVGDTGGMVGGGLSEIAKGAKEAWSDPTFRGGVALMAGLPYAMDGTLAVESGLGETDPFGAWSIDTEAGYPTISGPVKGDWGPEFDAYGTPISQAKSGLAGLWDQVTSPIGGVKGAPSWLSLGSSLYSAYTKNQLGKAQMDRYNQNQAAINSMYAPGSPEYNLLKQELERSDAAAGRNSQYGTRLTELGAQIASKKLSALTGSMDSQNNLFNKAQGNRYGSLNGLFFTGGQASPVQTTNLSLG